MEWLNYNHLYYFWLVAREGSIARACEQAQLTQPTISTQIRKLERALGQKLFSRAGRGLQLTDAGKTTFRYADEMFSLGRELTDTLKNRPTGRPLRLTVGVSDVLPKLIVYRLLEPIYRLLDPLQIVCREGKPDLLLTELAAHNLDLVLTDAPVGTRMKVRAYSHLLGESTVSIFGARELAHVYRNDFPRSLKNAPFLLPVDNTSLRRSLDQWFDAEEIHPEIKGEFDDNALMEAFGQAGIGLFPASTAIAREVATQYGVREVGRIDAVHERFYAISVERKIKHPAVMAMAEAARSRLFT